VPDAVEVVQDLEVREAEYSEALRAEPCVSLDVVRAVLDVLAAVDFNEQPRVHADEVCDVTADRFLPTKLVAIELASAKCVPEQALCVC
jgi:hypothetical protein